MVQVHLNHRAFEVILAALLATMLTHRLFQSDNPGGNQLKSEFPVYIVGTTHEMQMGNEKESCKETIRQFENFVEDVCIKKGIQLIAEEASCDALSESDIHETVCQRVSKNLKLAPVEFLDIDRQERANLAHDDFCQVSIWFSSKSSLPDSKVNEVSSQLLHETRERIWIMRFFSCGELNAWPRLFVCGAYHVRSVSALFNRVGVGNFILEEDFGEGCS